MAIHGPFAKIFGVLKQIAPTLLTGFGGPAGALVATIAKKALGNEAMNDGDLEAAVTAATTTPEGLVKLKSIEADLKAQELEHDFKFSELVVDDRKDARARDAALKGDPTTRNLAYLIVGAFIALATAVAFGKTVGESTLVGTIVGYMVSEAKQVTAYYFGSSSGSRSKDLALQDLAKEAQP